MRLADIVETSSALAATPARREKVARLADTLSRLSPEEAEIGASFLAGEPRQGRIGVGSAALRAAATEGVLVDAVARASGAAASEVRRAAMSEGRLAPVAAAALSGGASALTRFRMRLLAAVQPMLAQTADGPEDALVRLREAALEYKLDGARVQVHRLGDEVRVFSRSLRDVTAAVPEIVTAALLLPATALVLGGEAISFQADGKPRPFQETMRRFGRKLDVDRLASELPITAWFFDVLHLDGEDLASRPARERLAALDALVPAHSRRPRGRHHRRGASALPARAGGGSDGAVARSCGEPVDPRPRPRVGTTPSRGPRSPPASRPTASRARRRARAASP